MSEIDVSKFEILPCPFCGEQVTEICIIDNRVTCPACGASVPSNSAAFWNHRIPFTPDLLAENEKLKEIVRRQTEMLKKTEWVLSGCWMKWGGWIEMKIRWVEFKHELFQHQELPPERKYVLVSIAKREEEGLPPGIGVGYLRYAAGCIDSPYFVMPGIKAPWTVTHWCDCLGNKFDGPLWKSVPYHGFRGRKAKKQEAEPCDN